MNYTEEVTNYINSAPLDQIKILESIRKLIHKNVRGVAEAIKWGMPAFASSKDFCYLRSNKNHVTFGFYNPEKIEDPENLLEGAGKVMKHVKIKSLNQINTKLFSKWIKTVAN